jgi:CheY-like chemotaxis protein
MRAGLLMPYLKQVQMSSCQILIIDDDTDDVEILAEAFAQLGVTSVHYVYTGIQAFTYLQQFEVKEELPKLIVTDIYLPGIRGDQLLIDLKKMDNYKHIHVIVLSCSKTQQEIERYRQMGAADYLVKPSSYNEYVEVAKAMLEKINF